MKVISILVLHYRSSRNETLSYQHGWPDHFRSHPRFHCTFVNLGDSGRVRQAYSRLRLRRGGFDAIVMLHSVFSNSCFLRGWLKDFVGKADVPKAFFIGNEYKLMPEKMSFCEELGVSLLVSQSESPAVHTLYRERLGCRVAGIPSGGVDARSFRANVPREDRPIDLGYRAFDSPLSLGHDERRRIADYFSSSGPRWGLVVDISLDPVDRFNQAGWAAFLNSCKGQLGIEAGTDYFELTDAIRLSINQYVDLHPEATMEKISALFFASYANPMPLRIISGRNAEAASTRTVQILFEGHYNGYFRPDEHYIPLKKDFSNAGDVIAKFRDENYCREVTENAYQLAIQELTYERLIDRFHLELTNLV